MAAGNVLPIIGIVAARLLAGAGRGMYEQAQQEKAQNAILSRQIGADGLKTAITQGNWKAVEAYTSDPKSGIDKNLGGMLAMLARSQGEQIDAAGQATQRNTVRGGEGDGMAPGAVAASTMGQAPQAQAPPTFEQGAGLIPTQRRFTNDVRREGASSYASLQQAQQRTRDAGGEPVTEGLGIAPQPLMPEEQAPSPAARGPQAPPVSEGTAQAGPPQAQPRGLSSINVSRGGDFREERSFKDPQTGAMVHEKPPKPEDLFRRLLEGAAAKNISYEPDELFDEVVRRGWINDIKAETLTRIGQLGYNRSVQRELSAMGARSIEELDPNERRLTFERAWQKSGVVTEAGLKEIYPDAGARDEAKLKMWAGLRTAKPDQSFSQARAELRARGIVLSSADELRFGQEEFGRVRNGIMAAWNRQNPTAPISAEQAGTLAVDTWFGGDRRFASDSERTRMDKELSLNPETPEGQLGAQGKRPPRAGDVAPDIASAVGAQQRAQAERVAQAGAQAGATERSRTLAGPLPVIQQERVVAYRQLNRSLAEVGNTFDPSFVGKGFTADKFRAEMAAASQPAAKGQYDGAAFGWLREQMGTITPREVEFRRSVTAAANQLLYAYSGKQINEQEFKRLSSTLASLWDEPGVFKSKLVGIQRDIDGLIEDIHGTAGRSVGQGMQPQQPRSAPTAAPATPTAKPLPKLPR